MVEKKKSPLYPDLKDEENETRRELLAAEEGVSSGLNLITTCLCNQGRRGEERGGQKGPGRPRRPRNFFWQLHTRNFNRLP